MQEAKQMTLPEIVDLVEFRDSVPVLIYDMNGEEIEVVDFKAVHAALGVDTRQNDWFRRLVTKYDFKQGEDFIALEYDPLKKGDWDKIQANGGKTTLTHYMTLDMAKEVCMVSASPVGKRVRRYFIVAEKVAKKYAMSHLKEALLLDVKKAETKALKFKEQADDSEAMLQEGVKKMGFKSVIAMQNKLVQLSDAKDHVVIPEDDLVVPRWKSLAKQTIIKTKAALEKKDYKAAMTLILEAYADMKRGEADQFSCYFRGDCQ